MPKGVTSLLSDGAAKRKEPSAKPGKNPDKNNAAAVARPNVSNVRARAAGSLARRLMSKKK